MEKKETAANNTYDFRTCTTSGDVDVCLVMPPMAYATCPSLALGILKSCLVNAGISCHVDYANMHMALALGNHTTNIVFEKRLGEYIFNKPAGITNSYKTDDYIDYTLGIHNSKAEHLYLKNVIEFASKTAEEQTEKTVDRILEYNPRLVGCSAVFQQRNASLAILRLIKKKRPDIVTFMGGYNCFGRAGIAMLKQFPFLDYVYFGESDDIIAPVTKNILKGGDFSLPYGVLKNGQPYPDTPPHRIVMDMDSVPTPDYDEFYGMFSKAPGIYALQQNPERFAVKINLETSRGCFWGQKHQCTFCGLNGAVCTYRHKSPGRVMSELKEITDRYHQPYIGFTDCIMPKEWFDGLLFEIAKWQNRPGNPEDRLVLHSEIRPDLSEEQVRLLSEAGYDIMLAGIESLSDHVLQLMHKGVSAIHNVALLKYGKKYGVNFLWNILMGIPGERPEDYTEQKKLCMLMEHFRPPVYFTQIYISRDSEYANHPEKYGMELVPEEIFRYISPENEEYIKDTAYRYTDLNEGKIKNPELFFEKMSIKPVLAKWRARFEKEAEFIRLDMYDENNVLYITDTRTVAKCRRKQLSGLERLICLMTARPVAKAVLYSRLDSFKEENINAAVEKLKDCGFLTDIKDVLLCLAVDVDRKFSYEMDYREFFSRLMRNGTLSDELDLHKSEKTEAAVVRLGALNGFVFDEETVNSVNTAIKRRDLF